MVLQVLTLHEITLTPPRYFVTTLENWDGDLDLEHDSDYRPVRQLGPADGTQSVGY